MAKKNLINADMLLSKPLSVAESPAIIETAEPLTVVVSEEKKSEKEDLPPLPSSLSEPILEVQDSKAMEVRATFIVAEATLEKIKAIAYWERQHIKAIVQRALEDYINSYEKNKGTIPASPTARQK